MISDDDWFCCFKKTKRGPSDGFQHDQLQVFARFIKTKKKKKISLSILNVKCPWWTNCTNRKRFT